MTTLFYARASGSGPLGPVFAVVESVDRMETLFVLRGYTGFCRHANAADCQAFEAHETAPCSDCRQRYPGGELDGAGRCVPCQTVYAAAHPPCQHPRTELVDGGPVAHPYRWCPGCATELPVET